jgi:hypothetical protein
MYIDEHLYFLMLYELYDMIGSVDSLAHSCYTGFEGVGQKYYKWATYVYRDAEVFVNAAFNIGDIADDIIGIVMYFAPLPWAGPGTTNELGSLFGNLVASFLNTPAWAPGYEGPSTNRRLREIMEKKW